MAKQSYQIDMYSSPNCHYCHSAKASLEFKGLKFNDFDVLADLEKRKEMVKLSNQMSIPVIVLKKKGQEDKILVGYNETELEQALEAK